MIKSIVRKVFGSANERMLKRMQPAVDRINQLEPSMKKLSDVELAGMTARFRERIDNGESLDELLPEAFAAAREAGVRAPGDAPLRRAAHRRHGAARGAHRRDADR